MPETRKLERMHVLSYVKVCVQKTAESVGHLVDITTQGLRVASPRALLPDSMIELRIDLPDDREQPRRVCFDAEVIWSRPSREFDCWDVGLRLIDLSDDDSSQIEQFIQTAAYRDRWLSIGNRCPNEG